MNWDEEPPVVSEGQQRESGQQEAARQEANLGEWQPRRQPEQEARSNHRAGPGEPQRGVEPKVHLGVQPEGAVSIRGERQRPKREQGKRAPHEEAKPPRFDDPATEAWAGTVSVAMRTLSSRKGHPQTYSGVSPLIREGWDMSPDGDRSGAVWLPSRTNES